MASNLDLNEMKQLTTTFFAELSKLMVAMVITHRRHQVVMSIIRAQADDTSVEDLAKLGDAALAVGNTIYPPAVARMVEPAPAPAPAPAAPATEGAANG